MGRHIENSYESKQYEREKLRKLSDESDGFTGGAYYDEDAGFYKKINKGKRSKDLKKRSNKKIRREEDLPNNVHKCFDYDWEMW